MAVGLKHNLLKQKQQSIGKKIHPEAKSCGILFTTGPPQVLRLSLTGSRLTLEGR